MPPEELYDLESDPWAMNNLAESPQPEHMAALERLRATLDRWVVESNDQGRFPEPPEVTARKGLTKADPAGNPSQQAIIDETESKKPHKKKR